ncbi:MAG: hypothetical protein KDC26_11100 [Armatimonadetes bacterium]|nr:hypothetical protein [Armatimonadota bacterium]
MKSESSAKTKSQGSSLGILLTGVAIGAAAAWAFSRRKGEKLPWDVDSVLDACDRAAAKLDDLLTVETGGADQAEAV